MWKTKNNLKTTILKYFLILAFMTIGVLWIFQFFFFNSFYKLQKINDINVVSNSLKKSQITEDELNNLAFDRSVCIEITSPDYNLIYSSNYFGKGCTSSLEKTYQYKFDFISKEKEEATYEMKRGSGKETTLIKALKLSNNSYAFINTSLEPIDSITYLIQRELLVITFLILFLSTILAYLFSKHLSSPIKEITEEAKKIPKGNYKLDLKEKNSIQEIEELSNTLSYATKELNKTDELRRDLMANVSHDLKTPLTMIKAYAELAKDLHINNKEKMEKDMDTIISESDRLTILVNDILSLSKMESIVEELELEEFDLVKLIEEILSKYKILQETEKYTFEFVHKQKEIHIKADKKKLEQVIYNLINNAINYTGENNLVIIKLINKKDIRVEITDTGKGIKEEDIPYIWDKYYKNKKKHKRNLIGTGLGLSIVKKILEQHHFTYGVESKKDIGTTFYFEIPTKKEE